MLVTTFTGEWVGVVGRLIGIKANLSPAKLNIRCAELCNIYVDIDNNVL